MIKPRYTKKSELIAVLMTALSLTFSVGTVLYGVFALGLRETWPELVLNFFYVACLVMIWMYLFSTRISTKQFNYRCSLCVGIVVLLRDILFPPPLASYAVHLVCLVLAVLLLYMLTFFYARKDWKTYSKRNLWVIYIVDTLISVLYTYVIFNEPVNDYTAYLLTEIWIRPALIYSLVVCFVSETEEGTEADAETGR